MYFPFDSIAMSAQCIFHLIAYLEYYADTEAGVPNLIILQLEMLLTEPI